MSNSTFRKMPNKSLRWDIVAKEAWESMRVPQGEQGRGKASRKRRFIQYKYDVG